MLIFLVGMMIGFSYLLYPGEFTVLESFTFLIITVILNRDWINRTI